jgi:ATP-binding cassette subfamily B protein
MKVRWIRLVPYAAAERRGLVGLVALMLLGVGAEVLKPWPLKLVVDHVLTGAALPAPVEWLAALPGGGTPQGLLAWLAGATLLVFLVREALGVMQGHLQVGVSARMSYALGAAAFAHLQRLSLRYHGRRPTGDLVKRIATDSDCVRKLLMGVALPTLTSLVSVVTMFAVLWRLDHVLSLIALFVAPLMALHMRLSAPRMAEREYRRDTLEGEVLALAEGTLTAIPVVQAYRREGLGDRTFADLAGRTVRAAVGATSAQLQFKLGVDALTAAGTALILLLGGWQALSGEVSVGTLLVFLAYLASLYSPLETLAYASTGYASAAAGARRVFELLDADDVVHDAPDARPLGHDEARAGALRLERVTVGYEVGRPVLRELDLEVRAGETLALVGTTGAGKSTVAGLLVRFLDPWQGRVTLGGTDVRAFTLASLRREFALVLQEPFLFPLTVADNIAYGRPGTTRAEIEAAAVAANADTFVRALPDGYDTVLGERGASLSGGERQRIAIARALLKDAAIVVLDEPTSALDTETESRVSEALARLRVGRTTVVIAHRLSTVRDADRVAVLEEGRVVEVGTPDELRAADGAFAALLRASGEELARAGDAE